MAATAPTMPTSAELAEFLARLTGAESATNDTERIDQVAALETLKSAAAAAQARISVSFEASQRAEQIARGVPAEKAGTGVAGQVALARRESPHKGNRLLGLAKALVLEMPHTLHALATGQINEWRATLVVGATAVLSREHRQQVDLELSGRLGALGDAGVQREARKIAYQPRPRFGRTTVREGRERAPGDPAASPRHDELPDRPPPRRAGSRGARGAHQARRQPAGRRRRTHTRTDHGGHPGRARHRSVSGRRPARRGPGGHDRPRLAGHGRHPGPTRRPRPDPRGTRQGITRGSDHADARARAWVRRLYTSPETGELVAMESTRREFPPRAPQVPGHPRRGVPHALVRRTHPARRPRGARAADGGETSERNGQGLCEQCNQAKESPGWAAYPTRAGPGRAVAVRSPTGHAYVSTPPALLAQHTCAPTQAPVGGRAPVRRLVRGPAPVPA